MGKDTKEWHCAMCGQRLTTHRKIIGKPVHTCTARPGKRRWELDEVTHV